MPVQEDRLKRDLGKALCEQTIAIRQRKRLVEEKWLQNRRKWMGFVNSRYRPSDTAIGNYRIPGARRTLERSIVRCVKLLTPSVKWFEVAPMVGTTTDSERLNNVDGFMWYLMRKKIKSRTMISQLVRCTFLYGMPILKTSVMVQKNQVWPTQRAVDPFAFYIYPETASSLDEAEDIFEDFLLPYEKYNTFVDKGIVEPINRADLKKPDWPYHLVERLAYQGITDVSANVDVRIHTVRQQLEESTNAFVSITEKWIRREGQLYQVYIAWNLDRPRIVGFFQSAYDDPMYRVAIHRSLPGETYTNAQMEDIVELDDIQNDTFNQFIDAVDYEQGFAQFGGSDGMRRDSFKMKGRAKWDFGPENPKETFNFVQPPITSTNLLRAWQIAQGRMESMGAAGSITEGQPGRNMPRAGGAVNNLINLGLADIQDVAELLEQEVLTPGLGDMYRAAHLIPDDQLMSIPNGQAVYSGGTQSNIIRKRDIIGDYEFEWVGSLQFQDESQRAQRLMIFLNMAPQLMPLLNQQGYTFDLAELVQTIWRSGIGERSLSKVVITLQEMQQKLQKLQQQSGQPGMPPDMMNLLNSVKQQAAQQGDVQGQNGNSRLRYNLPPVTNGFVQQGG